MQWLIVGPTIFAVSLLGLGFYLAKQRLWNLQKMGSVPQAIATLIGAVVLIVGWIVSNNQSIERDILTKQRDQSSAIGEYVALARTLNSDDAQVYRRANQLAWQLFIWLPTDVYRGLGRGLANPADSKDLVDFLSLSENRSSERMQELLAPTISSFTGRELESRNLNRDDAAAKLGRDNPVYHVHRHVTAQPAADPIQPLTAKRTQMPRGGAYCDVPTAVIAPASNVSHGSNWSRCAGPRRPLRSAESAVSGWTVPFRPSFSLSRVPTRAPAVA